MRLPKAIRFLHRAIALAALLLAGLTTSRAQYSGGPGDGYAQTGMLNAILDGHSVMSPAYTATASGGDGYSSAGRANIKLDGILPPVQVFTASVSGGDGYTSNGRLFVPIDGTVPPAQVYSGGLNGGDGYAFARLSSRALDGTASLLVVYVGGSGDGYDADGLINKPVDPNALVHEVYSGGAGDGYDRSGVSLVSLGGSDPALAVIYTASPSGGDGYDFDGTRFQALDGNSVPTALFVSSGTGDGYDFSRVSSVQVNGEPAFVLTYLGGAGDGYSASSLPLRSINGNLAVLEPYTGGAGDGYDTKTLPLVQYLGGGEAAAGITFAGWRNSRFSEEEINAGLADPNTDADFDGFVNLLEFALGSDPRVSDAILFGPDIRLSNLSDLGLPALSDHYLTAIVRRNPLALDATLRVEVSDDTTAFWSTNDTIQVDASPSVIIVRDEFGMGDAPRRIMRVRATLNP